MLCIYLAQWLRLSDNHFSYIILKRGINVKVDNAFEQQCNDNPYLNDDPPSKSKTKSERMKIKFLLLN